MLCNNINYANACTKQYGKTCLLYSVCKTPIPFFGLKFFYLQRMPTLSSTCISYIPKKIMPFLKTNPGNPPPLTAHSETKWCLSKFCNTEVHVISMTFAVPVIHVHTNFKHLQHNLRSSNAQDVFPYLSWQH